MRADRATCTGAVGELDAIAAGDPVDPAVAAHVRTCLHCQADLARIRRLRRALRSLRDQRRPAPADSLAAVLAAIDEAAHGDRSARLTAYLGGIAAVTAAGGALVYAARSRRLRPAS